jgi:hypothetical protein
MRSSAHRPLKSQQHEAADPAPKPIEQTPVQQSPATTDRFLAALDEIEALVGDKYPISRAIQDIIRRTKS